MPTICIALQKRKPRGEPRRGGPCRSCGADLIAWGRVGNRNLQDVPYTFQALQKELIRHSFWHRDLDLRALNYARRKGAVRLREAALRRLQQSVGKAKNVKEGQQTPMEGNPIFYAQHAVAACCRKCIEYWHGIAAGRELTQEELEHLLELVMCTSRPVCRIQPVADENPSHPKIRS